MNEKARQVIARGGVIAFRTDTFYGLGANPLNELAVRNIKQLKGREEGKPILLLVSDFNEIERFIASRSALFNAIAKRFWPGPLTLIGAARPELSDELTAAAKTIGVRLPDDERVRELVRSCGGALTATSANPAGSTPAKNAAEVRKYFPSGIDLIIDDGEVTATEPSTVLDLSADEPRVVREGAISRLELGTAIRL